MADQGQCCRALVSAARLQKILHIRTAASRQQIDRSQRPPRTSNERLASAAVQNATLLNDGSLVQQDKSEPESVLYLAYGSNLSIETFRGARGIKPISQINVQVPSLRLTFDLPGIPYAEPCFANTARRDPDNDLPPPKESGDEKSPFLSTRKPDYHKDRWHKGLIGVVYEVTPEDYAHIIATEGGGASYHDILVPCHPLDTTADPHAPVPQRPSLPAFSAHTLFAPAIPDDEGPPTDGGRLTRPDASYAQASARYLKLITDGAAELELPLEYQAYLRALRPYTPTLARQRLGQFVFLALWMPIVMMIFALGKVFVDERGRLPPWLRELSGAVFKGVWDSYDGFFGEVFGDGERTLGDDGDDVAGRTLGDDGDVAGRGWRDVEKGGSAWSNVEKNAGGE